MWSSIANSHLLSSRISKLDVCVYVRVYDPTQTTNILVKQKFNTWGGGGGGRENSVIVTKL